MSAPAIPPTPTADAAALMARVATAQDRAAFAELFVLFAPRLKNYLLRQGADEATAEELVQEVMLTVWRRAGAYDARLASVSTWMFTIARNKRIDFLRRVRHPEALADDPAFAPDPVDGADVTYELAESGDRLRMAFRALSPEQAELMKLAFFHDLSHRAIAEQTRIPLGTVKSRIRLALARLRGLLQEP